MAHASLVTGVSLAFLALIICWIGGLSAQHQPQALEIPDQQAGAIAGIDQAAAGASDAASGEVAAETPAVVHCHCRVTSQIEALALQVSPGHEVLALIDKRNETICLYKYDFGRGAHETLVLLAARSFKYDRKLEALNTAEPLPDQIRQRLAH